MFFGDSELCDWSLFDPERSAMVRKYLAMANMTVNYVCREHVDGKAYSYTVNHRLNLF